MKKLLLALLTSALMVSCAEGLVEESHVSDTVAGGARTLTATFEGNDTRIQLNEELNTVWTNGDEVSVFYLSNVNTKFVYEGETGARTATLSETNYTANTKEFDTENIIVAYPYNYYHKIDESGVLSAMMPATQSYLANSYGVGSNLMVALCESTSFTLKSSCGWLRLSLTGDGEVVKRVELSGNNNEQVAGIVHVDAATATLALANEDDYENDIQRKVTLDCGEGVTLGAEATTFYIALPPQTFESGFTVDVICDGNSRMVKATSQPVEIKRNVILPMAELGYEPEPFYISSDRTILASSKGQTGTITYGFNAEKEGASIVATSDSEWITVEIPEVAEGEEPTNSVSYHIAPATTTEPRTGNITLTYADFSQTVVVEQDGGTHAFVVYTNSDILYNYEAHEVTIGYDLELPEAGVEVTATLSEQVDWITDITNTYDATKSTSGNIAFNVAEHTTKGDRQVTLTIAYGDKKYDILILQEDNFPDDVVMNVVGISASMRTGGKVWDLTLTEKDNTLGEIFTQITVGMRTANTQYLVSDTYKTPVSRGKGVYEGSVDAQGTWSNSVYRYNSSRKEAITDCELTIAIDEATQTAAISGHFVSKQTNDETGRTVDVNVLFEWNGPVQGFRWEDPTAEITSWKTFAIDSAFDDCKCIKGVSNGGNEVAIYLHTPGATTADALAAGTYPIADWVLETTANYCESKSTKVNGNPITSGSVTVEGSDDNYTVSYELKDGSGTTYKGVYTGAL